MKRPGVDGGFILCFLLNIILNLGWTIPAWVLLICHFVFKISLWWFVGALAIWFVAVLLITVVISAASSIPGTSQPVQTPEQRAAKEAEIREISRSTAQRQPPRSLNRDLHD